jgi:hypothetical protein
MKKPNKSAICPLCGGDRKPGTKASRADVRDGRAVVRDAVTTITDSVVTESSDDKTANDFAQVLLNVRERRL